MQNRTFLVLLRPIFCEKLKIAPPTGKQPPSNVWISGFGRKISLKFGEDLFFLETTWFWAEKTFEILSFPTNLVSSFGQTVWNWFKNNKNLGQGRLHFSHSFKTAPLFQILATRLVASQTCKWKALKRTRSTQDQNVNSRSLYLKKKCRESLCLINLSRDPENFRISGNFRNFHVPVKITRYQEIA